MPPKKGDFLEVPINGNLVMIRAESVDMYEEGRLGTSVFISGVQFDIVLPLAEFETLLEGKKK